MVLTVPVVVPAARGLLEERPALEPERTNRLAFPPAILVVLAVLAFSSRASRRCRASSAPEPRSRFVTGAVVPRLFSVATIHVAIFPALVRFMILQSSLVLMTVSASRSHARIPCASAQTLSDPRHAT